MYHEPNPHLREATADDFAQCQVPDCGETFDKRDGRVTLRGWTCGTCLAKPDPDAVSEPLDPHDPQTRSDRWG